MVVGMKALRDGHRLSDYNILKERWKASCEPTSWLLQYFMDRLRAGAPRAPWATMLCNKYRGQGIQECCKNL